MARVKRGVVAHARHKKVLEQAKGFYGRRKNTIRTAKAAVDKAGQYAYRDRKTRKRAPQDDEGRWTAKTFVMVRSGPTQVRVSNHATGADL